MLTVSFLLLPPPCLSDVEKIYRERLDYKEGMAEIFNALAAKELGDLARFKDSSATSNNRDETDCERRVVDYLGRAENQIRGHAYSCLIKGFYEMRQGMKAFEIKNAA
jgi:hypothetical protein